MSKKCSLFEGRTLSLALVVLSLGCGSGDQSKDVSPNGTASKLSASPEIQSHMQDHFAAIRRIEEALIEADLVGAQTLARKLVEHKSDDTLSADHVRSLRKASNALATSESLESASNNAAQLASTCGSCHLETSTTVSFEWIEALTDTGQAGMPRHKWAMDRLWEGLAGPSDISWEAGVEVLRTSPIRIAVPLSDGSGAAQIAAMTQLNALAQRASEYPDRTKFYGALLNTCSGCHAKLGASPTLVD